MFIPFKMLRFENIERRYKSFAIILICCAIIHIHRTVGQDYDVSDIQCSYSTVESTGQNFITAKLKRPPGFKGDPLFADERTTSPDTDYSCTIKRDPSDTHQLAYNLKIIDFNRCGVLNRNGFLHVRIWFPQYPGVVMQSDQELIIMCKPPEPTVIENKAAGFAGSFPYGARVSGVVEESPGRLEYEVALYKEAPANTRVSGSSISSISGKDQPPSSNELPIDQAVQIGTKLQLRARISQQSVWRYVKLTEVTVSPDPDRPHAYGAVWLIKNGCRNRDFTSIIPHQPARYRDRPNEVFLDFEAFLLSSMTERATLWIHSQIKACMEAADCAPDLCMNLYEPTGHGRKRRYLNSRLNQTTTSLPTMESNTSNNDFTRFTENLHYTVVMPKNTESLDSNNNYCRNTVFVTVSFIIVLLTGIICLLHVLVVRLQAERLLLRDKQTMQYPVIEGLH